VNLSKPSPQNVAILHLKGNAAKTLLEALLITVLPTAIIAEANRAGSP
ncbi:unnamed protein product, partial [Acidithrix sp. C25]